MNCSLECRHYATAAASRGAGPAFVNLKMLDGALYACLPITAIAYNIPLILLGENPALSWGTDVGGSLDCDGNRMKMTNTLKGGNPRQFAPADMSDDELYWYYDPEDAEMERARLKIVYLGYFMPDFNDHTNSRIPAEHGLQFREGADAAPENMGGIYPFVALDDDFVVVNQMMKYLKFGFGKATQEVGSAIRFGLLSRDEGLELLRKYDGKYSQEYMQKLCDYLEMPQAEFWKILEPWINKDLFERHKDGWRATFHAG